MQYGGLSILKLFQITCKSFDFMSISSSLPLLDSRSMETLKLLNADFSSMYAIINAIDIRSFHWR